MRHPAPIEFNIDSSRIYPMDLLKRVEVPTQDQLIKMRLSRPIARSSCIHAAASSALSVLPPFGLYGEGTSDTNKFDLNRVKRVPVFAKKKPIVLCAL